MITDVTGSREIVLAELIDEITRRMRAGQAVDIDALTREHPELAGTLIDLLPAVKMLTELRREEQTGAAAGPGPDAGRRESSGRSSDARTLGDFRLLREIGRGGMGVVYEAEQVSLSRTVALKVLPFAAMLDSRQLSRFRNEARAAASLHHTNIVPVHSVGCERGVHYYAMQYIEGESLAHIVAELRRLEGQPDCEESDPSHNPRRLAALSRALASGQLACGVPSSDSLTTDWSKQGSGVKGQESVHPFKSSPAHPLTPSSVHPAADTTAEPHAFISTARSDSGRAYFRAVAELGIQAAEALDYAHQQGVIHRDIKPANLLLDETGRLWITDFGLARLEADAGMTMTGDLVGTLRYMSPEQALAKRVVVDHRTDIYSLGITLYEVLALRPAFDGDDRQQLLKHIAFDDPPLLRKVNRQIPPELETILHKSFSKNPEHRYATARDVADDLRSFLANRPIKAKPPTWRQRGAKWMRRHPAGVRATALALLAILIVCAATLGWTARDRATRQAVLDQQITQALEETESRYKAGKPSEAMSAMRRAEGLLASGDGSDELQQRVVQWRTDLETVQRLEQIRLDQAVPPIILKDAKADRPEERKLGSEVEDARDDNKMFDMAGANRSYQEVFRSYGLSLESLDAEQSSRRIRNSPIKQELVAALDDWFQVSDKTRADQTQFKRNDLLQVARLADPDPWRDRLRDAIQRNDHGTLTKLAAENDILSQPPQTVLLLARALDREKQFAQAADVLRPSQRRHPADFWLNVELARCLAKLDPTSEKGLGFQRAALALRPDSPAAHNGLGAALYFQGNYADAEAAFRDAIRLKPEYRSFHVNIGNALSLQQKDSEAEAAFHEAIRLEPENPATHLQLSNFLYGRQRYAEAEAALREAIRIKPDFAPAYSSLGYVYSDQGKYAEAEAAIRECIRIKPDNPLGYRQLTTFLQDQGKRPQAFQVAEEALRTAAQPKPGDAAAFRTYAQFLALVLRRKEAEAAFREAIRLDPTDARTYNDLGVLLQENSIEAEKAFRKASELSPRNGVFRGNLGIALEQQGKLAEAEEAFHEAIRLLPNNAWAHTCLGALLNKQDKYIEAAAAFREAIRLQPRDRLAHTRLGNVLAKQAAAEGSDALWNEAAAEFVLAIDLSADGPSYSAPRKRVCRELAQWDEVFERVAKLRPDERTVWTGRGQDRALRSRWSEAIGYYAKVMDAQPVSTETDEYASLLLIVGDTEGYQNFCRALAERPGEPHNGYAGTNMARACSIGRPDAVDATKVVEWATLGIEETPNDTFRHFVLGLAHYRAGQYERATECVDEALKKSWEGNAQSMLVRAMSQHRLGHADEALKCLEKAKQMITSYTPKKAGDCTTCPQVDWIGMHVLLPEAEALIGEVKSSSTSAEATK